MFAYHWHGCMQASDLSVCCRGGKGAGSHGGATRTAGRSSACLQPRERGVASGGDNQARPQHALLAQLSTGAHLRCRRSQSPSIVRKRRRRPTATLTRQAATRRRSCPSTCRPCCSAQRRMRTASRPPAAAASRPPSQHGRVSTQQQRRSPMQGHQRQCRRSRRRRPAAPCLHYPPAPTAATPCPRCRHARPGQQRRQAAAVKVCRLFPAVKMPCVVPLQGSVAQCPLVRRHRRTERRPFAAGAPSTAQAGAGCGECDPATGHAGAAAAAAARRGRVAGVGQARGRRRGAPCGAQQQRRVGPGRFSCHQWPRCQWQRALPGACARFSQWQPGQRAAPQW